MTYRERLQLAWQLTWPLAAIDLGVMIWLHGILNVRGETYDSVWALMVFFLISPWVIQRAFRRTYGKRRIEVVRRTAPERGPIHYQECLKEIGRASCRERV